MKEKENIATDFQKINFKFQLGYGLETKSRAGCNKKIKNEKVVAVKTNWPEPK